jgi:hypothetical protein
MVCVCAHTGVLRKSTDRHSSLLHPNVYVLSSRPATNQMRHESSLHLHRMLVEVGEHARALVRAARTALPHTTADHTLVDSGMHPDSNAFGFTAVNAFADLASLDAAEPRTVPLGVLRQCLKVVRATATHVHRETITVKRAGEAPTQGLGLCLSSVLVSLFSHSSTHAIVCVCGLYVHELMQDTALHLPSPPPPPPPVHVLTMFVLFDGCA